MTEYFNFYGQAMVTSPLSAKYFFGNGKSSTLVGTGGDDIFYVWSQDDQIIEATGAIATDIASIWGSYTYYLPANVANLEISGTLATVYGNSLSNLIIAEGSNNLTIDGEGGSDVIVANTGQDTFVMQEGYGHQVIYGFNPAADAIRLTNFDLTAFGEVAPLITEVGQDAVITLNANDSVTLRHTTASSLTAANFLLPINLANDHLTFDSEFNTFVSSPDGSSGWMTTFPYSGIDARTLSGNGEAEYYSDSSVGVNPFSDSNGVLTITASPATPGSQTPAGSGLTYTSGLITTYKSFSQLYGYFEVRAQLPSGAGFWPAFWLLPANNTWPPELDVFEMLGSDPKTVFETSHTDVGGFNSMTRFFTSVPTATTGFNTYGVDWEKNTITWYMNGVAVASTATPADMNSPMYMLLNLGVGGAGSIAGAADGASASMEIDYVRAYASGSAPTTVTVATFLSEEAALNGTPVSISDSSANVIANLASLNADASGLGSIAVRGAVPTVTTAALVADRTALDLVDGGFNVSDGAAALVAAIASLSDPHILSIVVSSGTPLTLTVAQLENYGAVLSTIKTSSGAAAPIAIADTAANINAALSTLGSIQNLASITVAGASLSVNVTFYLANAAALDKIVNGFVVGDTSGAIGTNIALLNDPRIIQIVDTTNKPVTVSVAQAKAYAGVLAKIVNANGSPVQLVLMDTFADVFANLSTISTLNTASILLTSGAATVSLATFDAYASSLDKISGGYQIADTSSNIMSKLGDLATPLNFIESINVLSGAQPSVSVYQFGEYRSVLDKIAGGFSIVDKATTIAAGANSLFQDASRIVSISSTYGAPTVSAQTFAADQSILNKIVGGFVVADTTANLSADLSALAGDAGHIDSLSILGAGIPTLRLSSGQAQADAAALQEIATPFVLETSGAGQPIDVVGKNAASAITAPAGASAITGGSGGATFTFDTLFGVSDLTDFSRHYTGAGADRISLPTADFASFSALLANSSQDGGSVVLSGAAGDKLTISDFTIAQLETAKSDFSFHS